MSFCHNEFYKLKTCALGLLFHTVKNKLSKFVNCKLLLSITLNICLHSTPLNSSKILGIVTFYLVIIIMTEQQLHLRSNSSNTKI